MRPSGMMLLMSSLLLASCGGFEETSDGDSLQMNPEHADDKSSVDNIVQCQFTLKKTETYEEQCTYIVEKILSNQKELGDLTLQCIDTGSIWELIALQDEQETILGGFVNKNQFTFATGSKTEPLQKRLHLKSYCLEGTRIILNP